MIFLSVLAILLSAVFYFKYWNSVSHINTKINLVADNSLGEVFIFKHLNSFMLLSHPAFTMIILKGQFKNVLDRELINLLSKARREYLGSIISFLAFGMLCIYQIHFKS